MFFEKYKIAKKIKHKQEIIFDMIKKIRENYEIFYKRVAR